METRFKWLTGGKLIVDNKGMIKGYKTYYIKEGKVNVNLFGKLVEDNPNNETTFRTTSDALSRLLDL